MRDCERQKDAVGWLVAERKPPHHPAAPTTYLAATTIDHMSTINHIGEWKLSRYLATMLKDNAMYIVTHVTK